MAQVPPRPAAEGMTRAPGTEAVSSPSTNTTLLLPPETGSGP